MRKVKRAFQPESLRLGAKRWTNELVKALKNNGKPESKYYNKYKKNDVLSSLQMMYGDGQYIYCCYCESRVNDVCYEHVEHRKPKSKFPRSTYEWGNLHLACPKCNGFKGDKYDNKNPILDATKDEIEDCLDYFKHVTGIYAQPLTERGRTTIKHTQLNRKVLLNARQDIYLSISPLLEAIADFGDLPQADPYKEALLNMCTGMYGSLISWFLKKYNITL